MKGKRLEKLFLYMIQAAVVTGVPQMLLVRRDETRTKAGQIGN